MPQPYASAQFLTSVAKPTGYPHSTGPEIAFAGRSNVGKSSTLNCICRRKSLARTSKTPGRTQLLNFFHLSTGAMLVDLPGYGFAKVPVAQRHQWGRLIEHYLTTRENLRGLVQVTDIRRPLSDYDWRLIEWCSHRQLPLLLLLNKADKLKYGAAQNAILSVRKSLADAPTPITVLPFSAAKATGLEAVHAFLDQWLEA